MVRLGHAKLREVRLTALEERGSRRDSRVAGTLGPIQACHNFWLVEDLPEDRDSDNVIFIYLYTLSLFIFFIYFILYIFYIFAICHLLTV